MMGFKSVLLLSCIFTLAAGQSKFFKGLVKEIRDVKHPVEETITYIGSSQCKTVKKITGVAYESVVGEKEPDVESLLLTFLSNDYNVTYNITTAAKSITASKHFNPRQKLFIFCHGFTDDPSKSSFGTIRNALFSQGQYNVLALDASSLIHWLYLRSSTYVRFIGERLGELLAEMVHAGTNASEIHIIGHSLGSHISGFAGKSFTNLTGMKVGRISGLDPAGPCFSHVEEELRLKATDAEYVDVIHTDAGVFGLWDPVGHVDYFPNEGSQQTNCFFQTCSHSRAWVYYAESVVNPEAFPSVSCKDWKAFKNGQCGTEISYMGHPSRPGTRGLYYLQTGDDSPYGLGTNGTRYKNDESITKSLTNKLVG